MTPGNPPHATATAGTSQWDEDLIFATLSDRPRRRLLMALARGGPQIAADLVQVCDRPGNLRTSACRLDVTLKQLAHLRKSGLVEQKPNPNDGRRCLYCISPSVPITRTSTGVFIDFGFCTLRLTSGS